MEYPSASVRLTFPPDETEVTDFEGKGIIDEVPSYTTLLGSP